MLTTRRPLRAGAALTMALAACTAGAFSASSALAQTPKRGGDLTIAWRASQEPASLDGHIDPYQSTWLFNSFVADPLVVLDSDLQVKPALATAWESNADGTVWTFTLRQGVTFQDGTPFDAAAVKYNIERILAPETASKQLANDIGPVREVEVVDDFTVRFHYDTPWVTLLDALRRAPIWSPTAAQAVAVADFQRSLVGTGPFRFREWVQNERIVFDRWEDYGGWNAAALHQGPAFVDSVTIRFIGENAVLNESVRTGETLAGFSLTPAAIEIYKDDPDFMFEARGQAGTGLQKVMNIRNAPLSDIRVRQALLYARDMEQVNDLLYDGAYVRSDGPLDNIHRCFWEGASEMYRTDPAKSAALLDEAGWVVADGQPFRVARGVAGVEDGTPLKVRWSTIHHREIGEAVQGQFRRIGVDLEVEQVPGPVQLDRVNRRDFDLMFLRQRSPDPLILDQVWNSKWDQPGGWAWTGFADEKLDGLLNQLRSLPSADDRCAVAKEAQQIIMENALMLPTLSEPVFLAWSPTVKDFKIGAEGNWLFLHSVWIDG